MFVGYLKKQDPVSNFLCFYIITAKYVFGNCWMPQYDVSREQYVEFVKDEFKKTRYYERLCCYHFYIARDDVDDLRPAIICNLTNTVPLYIINEKLITKLSFGEQRILRQGDRVSVSALKDGHLLKFMYTNAKLPFGLDQCPRITSNYFIGRKIGSGGAADVFLMWQINMHYGGSFGQVALKIIHKNKNLISEKNAEIENKRVMREVTAMRQFNNVHVLKLLNYDNKKEHLYIVVPYMEGGNLISRITEYYDKPYIDEDMSRYFFRQLLIGIKYMHSKGWVHRDIKPDNILLSDTTPFPILVISDFGLSKILDNDNTICGTAGYSAPELLQKNKQYDNKIDSWACGIVLYAMLSGNMPFHESYKRHLGIGMNEQVMEANVIFRHPGFLNVS